MPSGSQRCGRCLQKPPALAATVAGCIYAEPIAGFVRKFKYQGDLSYGHILVELLTMAVTRHLRLQPAPDLIVAMPMHWRRRLLRGFNQAQELAAGLCSHPQLQNRQLQTDTRLVRRTRHTKPQRALDATGRRKNLTNAFSCQRQLHGQHVVIIDDVMTTGASANALAKTLLQAGAGRVELWCCARTPLPGPD